MGDAEFVDKNICILRHEIQDTKFISLEKDIDDNKQKVDDCFQMFNNIKDLQMKSLYATVTILIVVILILIGVLLGRGIDFGLIFSGV